MATLIDKIQEAMLSDDADREKQSAYLEQEYNESNKAEKKRIDDCFIALCGWSLKTLMEK